MLQSVHTSTRNVLKRGSQKFSCYSTLSYKSYPYKFLVGTGYIGKPLASEPRINSRHAKQMSLNDSLVKFPYDTDIAKWTLNTLDKRGRRRDIGEDFFFVQSVCFGSEVSCDM